MEDNAILDRFNDLLLERAGIHFPNNSLKVLEQRLKVKLAQLGLDSAHAYYELLLLDAEEFVGFLDFVTTNLSYFYRKAYHYEVLKDHVIPQFIKSKRMKMRIWSAGCSTGEEPYTLAMLFEYLAPHIQVEIQASDISSTCITIAKQGIYPENRVQKLPRSLLDKYMHKLSEQDIAKITNNGANKLLLYKVIDASETFYKAPQTQEHLWQVTPQLRQKVQFMNHNLSKHSYEEFTPPPFDLIFCCNVLIYFHPEVQERVSCQFAQVLAPDGWLFLGHTEYINNMHTPFISSGIEPTCYVLGSHPLSKNNEVSAKVTHHNSYRRPNGESNFCSVDLDEPNWPDPSVDSATPSLKDLRSRIKKATTQKTAD